MFWSGKVLGEFCVCYALPMEALGREFLRVGEGWSIFYIMHSFHMSFLKHERHGQRIAGTCCSILSILMLPRKQVRCGFCLTLLLGVGGNDIIDIR